MAASNLDLVRSIYAAWERGDYSAVDWVDPDIEYIHPDGPEPGHWTGLAGMRTAARERLSAWDNYRPEAEDYRELDGDRVLVLIRFRGRGKTSGLDLERMRPKGATLFHVHGGKVTKIVQYLNRDRALADLGLARAPGAQDQSVENAEIVRRAFEAVGRKPKPDFETINALFHPDHRFTSLISEVEGRGFAGAGGFREWLGDIAETFDAWGFRVDRLQAIDDDRVLLCTVFSARGRGGGVPIERRSAAIVTVQGGQVIRTESYPSPEDALEAAGLEE